MITSLQQVSGSGSISTVGQTNLSLTAADSSVTISSSSGNGITIPAATDSVAGVLDAARATIIDGVPATLAGMPKSNLGGIVFVIDGGGSAIGAGLKGFLPVPFPATLTGWTLLADQAGSIAVDVWKVPYASFPPSSANTICAGLPPTLSSVQASQSGALTGWVTAINPGDVLAFNVISAATVTRVSVLLNVLKL